MQDEWISGSKDFFSVWERHCWKKYVSFNGWFVAYNPSVWTACHQRSLLVILLSLWFWETDQRWLGLLTPRAKQWKTVGFREGQAFSAAFATKVTRVQLTRLKGAFACGNSCGPQEFKIDLTVLTWSCPSCLWDDQDGSCLMDLSSFVFYGSMSLISTIFCIQIDPVDWHHFKISSFKSTTGRGTCLKTTFCCESSS